MANGRAGSTKSETAAKIETEKIPEDLAVEIRRLTHDLSNALEIVIQTSYLLGTTGLKEPAAEWLKMLDGGVEKALAINGSLRSFVKQHSAR